MSKKSIAALILAGGKGTRLALALPGHQKVAARVHNRHFLEYLLSQLEKSGFTQATLCTGYLSNQVEERIGGKYKNITLTYSREDSPLGTAGAIALALPRLMSDTILIMNGDSFCDIDLKQLIKFHFDKKARATVAAIYASNTDRFGKLDINAQGQITGFLEKKSNESGWINGGIYLVERFLLSKIPKKKFISLENEVFPTWVGNRFYAYKTSADFIDIGTPDSFVEAQKFFKLRKL